MPLLTDEQNAFLEAEGKIILCACPGSGKTFVVGKKLLKYLENWPFSYRGVAVLSFTNVASKEILHQAAEIVGHADENIGFPHYIGTLDSFINSFIFLRFGYMMFPDDKKRPKIIHGNFGSIPYSRKECYQAGCAQNPEWFHWGENQLLKNNKTIECPISQKKPCVSYKKSMLQKGLVTQREVPALTLRLLKKYPQIADEIAYRFPVIIIDEAQDTSREQMAIFEFLSKRDGTTVILVGDPDQAIYEWRDATPEYFSEKLNASDWTPLYLTANFRSSQHICNATQLFSSVLSGATPAEARGECAEYTQKPILLRYSEKSAAISWFKDFCQQHDIDSESNSVAILTRGRIHDSSNITGLWQTTEAHLLASATYLWYSGAKKDAYLQCEKALFSIMIADASGITSADIRHIVENEMDYPSWKKKVIGLLGSLPKHTESLLVWKCELISIISEKIEAGEIIVRNSRSPEDLIKIKTKERTGEKYSTEFLEQPLYKFFEKRTSVGTVISSVHGVKGETFDATLLIVDSKSGKTITPSFLEHGDLDSELMRIAYVAMTRPRKLLVVAMPNQKKNQLMKRFPKNLWDYIDV